ncbi:gamma-glutamyl-gamma-aminobutyrate hydrolase family protein [Legionella sp. CNM-1927-20]|uniref:gamma-glutamyl-gamma-aminobutyrate hydrolase family protein n=1 Tax=Legionella sp. CNM-1927-20 TaxID=3422221 RepID=UPI00403B31EC
MVDIKVAVTDSPEVGSLSAPSLKKAFSSVNFDVIDADFRAMMKDIPKEEFEKLYTTVQGRTKLFAHAKYMATRILDKVDCLALSGNIAMIDPLLFNEPRDKNCNYDFSRTIAELALIHVATQKGMPILGICGGHEAIAVYYGSILRALSPAELNKQGYMSYDKIIFNTQSILGQLFNSHEESLSSNSPTLERNFFGAHKQVVDRLGTSYLNVTARASDNKLIEAVEGKYGAPVIGTQSHPEITIYGILPDSSYMGTEEEKKVSLELFHFFFKAARTYNNKKRLEVEIKKEIPKRQEVAPKVAKDTDLLLKERIRVKTSTLIRENKPNQNGDTLIFANAESIQQNDIPSKTLLNNPATFWKRNKRLHSELDDATYDQNKRSNTK